MAKGRSAGRGVSIMINTGNIKVYSLPDVYEKVSSDEVVKLREQMYDLQLEVDILKETINVLKKGPDIDCNNLNNKEKTAVINTMKNRYPLPVLLGKLNLARSSYYYQIDANSRSDKYKELREKITRIFTENEGLYGYRRIYNELKKAGINVSEKVIRRLMKEEGLQVKTGKAVQYNSHKRAVTPTLSNDIENDFLTKTIRDN